MKLQSSELLKELSALTLQHAEFAQQIFSLPDATLQQRPGPDSWNALECIEHLNRYGHFYLPEIEKRLQQYQGGAAPGFRSGLLGNYFAKTMWPKEKLNKMKTFRAMNPSNTPVDRNVIEVFIDQQQTMLKLLKRCTHADLNKIKTSVSISAFIKLRLGDSLRVVIYHNERHIRQAKKAMALT
ncbi:DinB family protein [Niabella insulamsoli]|uniref:DinB family protein n=1 Tax=Niabella insulamsoli TaxID=3144874 RepID=UPI0031FCBBFE